jgi:hypothetical protein
MGKKTLLRNKYGETKSNIPESEERLAPYVIALLTATITIGIGEAGEVTVS